MKKILVLLLTLVLVFAFVGCSTQTNNTKSEDDEKETSSANEVYINPSINIKGSWIVTSTPEPLQLNSYTDYQDSAKLTDSTIRASINSIFPVDGIIDIYENGIASCNGISMEYKFVAGDAVEFKTQGSGLIFKVSENGDGISLKMNDKYEVTLAKK